MLETIATGAGSGFFGVLLAWMGFKSRLDNIEKTIITLVNEKECRARNDALGQRINNASDRFDRIDAKIEVILQILLEQKSGSK